MQRGENALHSVCCIYICMASTITKGVILKYFQKIITLPFSTPGVFIFLFCFGETNQQRCFQVKEQDHQFKAGMTLALVLPFQLGASCCKGTAGCFAEGLLKGRILPPCPVLCLTAWHNLGSFIAGAYWLPLNLRQPI